MKAVLCKEFGPPETLVVEDIPSPEAKAGQVVLQVHAAAVNFPDVLIIENKYQFKPPLPFAPGGEVAGIVKEVGEGVTSLKVGDRVITRDNGIQEIRWAGAKELSGAQLAANDHLQPVLIQAGALGHNLPERDILVSPQHRMLLTTDQATMYFEEREVLVAAKHLTMLDGVDRVESSGTTYIHIMFEQHEVVLSNGTWSDSFQPGEYTLDGIGKEQRDEILELFPELAKQVGTEAYQSARRTLQKYEAALLIG